MADDFNPYHVWLAIPPDEQPANFYRLLGVRQFETNADVIDSAADRQMAHLPHVSRRQAWRPDATAVERSGRGAGQFARIPRSDLNTTSSFADWRPRHPRAQRGQTPLPLRRPAAAADAAAAAAQANAEKWDDLLGDTAPRTPQNSGIKSAKSLAAAAKQDAKNRKTPTYIAAAGVLVVAAGIGFFLLNRKTEGTLVLDWPASDLTDVAISVDGTAIEIPSSGHLGAQFPRRAASLRCPASGIQDDFGYYSRLRRANEHRARLETQGNAVAQLAAGGAAGAGVDDRWPPTSRIAKHAAADSRRAGTAYGADHAARHRDVRCDAGRRRRSTGECRRDCEAARGCAAGIRLAAGRAHGAAMTVDGQLVPGFNVESFEMKLKPGRHEVHINRPGFLTFNQTVDLVPGVNPPLRPIWRPAPTRWRSFRTDDAKRDDAKRDCATPPKVAETTVPTETTTPSEATNPQPAKKQPAPPAAEQEQVAKQLDELYKISRPGSKDAAKAQELYDVASKPGASPVERYMLLLKGAEIAAVAGDLSLSMQGIDTLDGDYEINALEIKQKLFDKFVTATRPEQLAISIPTAEQLIDQAIAADQYPIALTLSTTASRAVTKSKIATRKEVEERLSRRRHDIHVLEPIHAAVKKAQETLDKNPADPEANTIVGRWRCLYKSDWTAGLPLLAKGSDEKLKASRRARYQGADRTGAASPTRRRLVGRGAKGSRHGPRFASPSCRRPVSIGAAESNVGLEKGVDRKGMAEIANLPRPTAATAPKPPIALDPFPTTKSPFASPAARCISRLGNGSMSCKWSTSRDRIAGTWKRDDTDLDCSAGEQTRLELPVVVNGGYDLEIEFTRTKGNADVVAPAFRRRASLHGDAERLFGSGRRADEFGRPRCEQSGESDYRAAQHFGERPSLSDVGQRAPLAQRSSQP